MKALDKLFFGNVGRFMDRAERRYQSVLWFTLKLILWVSLLVVITPFLISMLSQIFKVEKLLIGDFILFITAAFIVAYTYETQKMREEITRQTRLQQMPILMLFVRSLRENTPDQIFVDLTEDQEKKKLKPFFILPQPNQSAVNHYLAIRNTGTGAAFNLEIVSDKFDVARYQSQFLAPHNDEQPFAILLNNNKIYDLDQLKYSRVTVTCNDVEGSQHTFVYRIGDIEKSEVNFIEYW